MEKTTERKVRKHYTEAVHSALVRKAKRKKWSTIRYASLSGGYRTGWLIETSTRGTMLVRLVGELTNRRLSVANAEYVTEWAPAVLPVDSPE